MECCGDEVDAYVVVYSVTDRSSFVYAQSCLADLKRRRKASSTTTTAVALVANKQDLVRNRVVSESGRTLAPVLLTVRLELELLGQVLTCKKAEPIEMPFRL